MKASLHQMGTTLSHKGIVGLILVLTGMIFNWGLEARKWQMLVEPIQRLSFGKAFSSVLSGVSVSINTPNRIGEYGGRVLYLEGRQNRLKGIAATMVGSLSQLITTIIFGLTGLAWYIWHFAMVKASNDPATIFWQKILLGGLIVICALTIFLYFRLQIILAIFEKIPILRKARSFVLIIVRYSAGELGHLLLLSAFRYMVFSAQYLILLDTLGVEMQWWQGFLMNAVVYLILAGVPTFAIAELGVRENFSLYFMGLLSSNSPAIFTATAFIWLINLMLPAVLGSVLLLGTKFFKEK
jgi:hypothetical protein